MYACTHAHTEMHENAYIFIDFWNDGAQILIVVASEEGEGLR